jgi:hypothetical protein
MHLAQRLLELLIAPLHLSQRLLESLIAPVKVLVASIELSFAPLDCADQAPEQHRQNCHDNREDDGRDI